MDSKKVARSPLHVVTITGGRYLSTDRPCRRFIDIRFMLTPPLLANALTSPNAIRETVLLPEFVHYLCWSVAGCNVFLFCESHNATAMP
jgi:hypothetical protein